VVLSAYIYLLPTFHQARSAELEGHVMRMSL